VIGKGNKSLAIPVDPALEDVLGAYEAIVTGRQLAVDRRLRRVGR
jgi:hypothetical protein